MVTALPLLGVESDQRSRKNPVLFLEDVLTQQEQDANQPVRPGGILRDAAVGLPQHLLDLAMLRAQRFDVIWNSWLNAGNRPSSSTTVCGARMARICRQLPVTSSSRSPARELRIWAMTATTLSCSRYSSAMVAICWHPQYSHIRRRRIQRRSNGLAA
jgi:hypothetical protein